MIDSTMGADVRLEPMMAAVTEPVLIKGTEGSVELPDVQAQAERARNHLVEINYKNVPGTCGDERPRVGLLSGEQTVEARPSVFGGPNIHALAIAELTGFFGDADYSGEERLRQVTRQINAAGIRSGGHEHCAANDGLGTWMQKLSDPGARPAILGYMKLNLGDRFDETVAEEMFAHADAVNSSGRYDGWNENVLAGVLGDEAGGAIEILADVPHEAQSVVRNKVPNTTVDQTALHNDGGVDSFVVDDAYADMIEQSLATGPDATHTLAVARHAREAIIAAVSTAVPNEVLYQVELNR
jgi:hypothetical protein